MAEEVIVVEAAQEDGRVALWEKHPDHPGGEVYITAGSGRHKVARTPAVLRALAEGKLIEHPRLIGPAEPAAKAKGKGGKAEGTEAAETPAGGEA